MRRCLHLTLLALLWLLISVLALGCELEKMPDCPKGYDRVDIQDGIYVCKEQVLIPDNIPDTSTGMDTDTGSDQDTDTATSPIDGGLDAAF
ncbi:MAG: hypothetical protein QNJ97_10995 [Myxococcota bacterium]|nr:hypothetical protein [Myxococcota bacterium]